MNKNTVSETPVMGRPVKPIKLPRRGSQITVSDLHKLNRRTIKARLTIYSRIGELVLQKRLRYVNETVPSNGKNAVGKPADLLEVI